MMLTAATPRSPSKNNSGGNRGRRQGGTRMMTLDLVKRRISLLVAAMLGAGALPAATGAAHGAEKPELVAQRLADQEAPDRMQFCTEQHTQQRLGQASPYPYRSQGTSVYAALMVMNGRLLNGMPQSYGVEFYSHIPWDVLQLASQARRLMRVPDGFHVLDFSVVQCNPVEFARPFLFDDLVEQPRRFMGFGSGAPTFRLKFFYYQLRPCNDDQICEQLQHDAASRAPASPPPQVQIIIRDPRMRPQPPEPPPAPFIPERNYPRPDYPQLPAASEIRPGQSVVALENASCSNQGNWLLTYQGTVVSTSTEEVQVFVNRRTGLYNYVGEPGPAGEKEKVWDKGYLCAPRREICFGDVDFDAWNGQITKGSPVPFSRDSIAVIDDVTKDPVPVFKHFLTRSCGAGPPSGGTDKTDKTTANRPAAGAESAATSGAPGAKAR
jgi:hypothetical protein